MIPLRHEHATMVMKAPPGEPEVRDLHVAPIDGCPVPPPMACAGAIAPRDVVLLPSARRGVA
jgi:hypothetical protein